MSEVKKLTKATSTFYPSRLHPFFVRVIQSISYAVAYFLYKITLKISDKSIDNFKKIADNRVVFLVNHPTFDDGIVMFLVSSRLGELFNYLVAQESFKGKIGKFLQLIGAYSIQRGLGDRKSLEYTLKLLHKPGCRLVVFPEGGCSFQNDTVMSFRSGVIQLALKVLNQLQKEQSTIPNFYLVPVTLKYRYTKPIDHVIEDSLHRLEKHYNINSPNQDFYLRLRQVAEQVLLSIEQQYGLNNSQNPDWNQRIENLREHILTICEEKLNLSFNKDIPSRERVYKMQSLLESLEDEPATYKFIEQATLRLLNFDAIYDGYVGADPTPERFMDTLTRLEREAFQIDQPPPKAHRQAIVKIGEPVNLKEYFSSYCDNRTATIDLLTQKMQQMIQANLHTSYNENYHS